MTPRILSLPLHVANQIAAGEVIESPASVVKELLENALDAKSTNITIDIGFGGLNHIIVSDNGIGIHPEDLPLVVAPHATSKLKTLEDLYALRTMGFRGEALASIASVSRVILTSRCQGMTEALSLYADEGRVKIVPAAREQGTTVEVRDLFHHIPVRKTFLKSEAIEYLNIEAVVKRFALAEPTIALKLIHHDQVKLYLPSATCDLTRQVRLKKLFGKTFFEHATKVDASSQGLTLTGWVGHPQWARSQSDRQWIYMNKRMVKDRVLNHAVKMAYETKIHPGKYPLYVLYFTISPSDVDVNVHPTKHEVRFTAPRLVHDFVYSAVLQALSQTTRKLESRSFLLSENQGQKKSYGETEVEPYVNFSGVLDWLTLNKHYAILRFDEKHFLVDVVRLRCEAQRDMCLTLPMPWASRPLLVPVVLSMPDARYIFETFQSKLSDFGFDLALEFHENLRINAIPAVLPLIDLHYFFQQLSQQSLDNQMLLKHLFASDAWSLACLDHDEKMQWWSYWSVGMKAHGTMAHTRVLDETFCEVLLGA